LRGIIIKDDKRYDHTQSYLERAGHVFCGHEAAAQSLDFVIFPFAAEVDKTTYNVDFFAALRSDTLIFSGIKHDWIDKNCRLLGLCYHVLMESRDVAAKNAVPTSEGVLAYLINNRDETIAGSRVLVVGYGICGRDLARRLGGLGADVTTLVRRELKEQEAQSDGFHAIYAAQFDTESYDIIINTVPQTILTPPMLEGRDGTLFIDIASKPYGLDMDVCKRLNPLSALLSGIPGKHAVKTAGEILGEHIRQVMEGKHNE